MHNKRTSLSSSQHRISISVCFSSTGNVNWFSILQAKTRTYCKASAISCAVRWPSPSVSNSSNKRCNGSLYIVDGMRLLRSHTCSNGSTISVQSIQGDLPLSG